MADKGSGNIDLAALDAKIVEIERALQLTLAFEVELRDSGGNSAEFVRGMVEQLETRLTALRVIRTSRGDFF